VVVIVTHHEIIRKRETITSHDFFENSEFFHFIECGGHPTFGGGAFQLLDTPRCGTYMMMMMIKMIA
jgi:hypothetical protein